MITNSDINDISALHVAFPSLLHAQLAGYSTIDG